MSNKEIARVFKLMGSLLELHGENPFKVKAYTGAVYGIENLPDQLEGNDIDGIIGKGFTKGIAEKISILLSTGSFPDLDDYMEKTPEGILDILSIKGLGAKKVKTIWKELGVDSIDALEDACRVGKVAELKGFGAKTQTLILEQIAFIGANQRKLRYADAEEYAQKLEDYLAQDSHVLRVQLSGQIRRKLEVIDTIQLVVATDDWASVRKTMDELTEIKYLEAESGPYVWRGELIDPILGIEIILTSAEEFVSELFLQSASQGHLSHALEGNQTLLSQALGEKWESEEALYEACGMQYVLPEMREGGFELSLAAKKELPQLVEMGDLKGILHNHSTYSDGRHTLRQMAEHCKELGYQYLGISDHSVSAFYANGLNAEIVKKQHQEIDELNQELAPFKIFKGIESDILNDGSLDYPDEVLASFDFIVASIHSNLKMDKAKATERLLRAIENPYTTMLGHPTGRLLLKREGYPIDHKAIIDACAKNNVVIEINANPWRLDLDWRWCRYALDQGVSISINPDAHEMDGYQDMKYGLLVGRKAGLTAEMTFNAWALEKVEQHFADKKAKALARV